MRCASTTVALLAALLFTAACPGLDSLSGPPPSQETVMGFATNCGQGATALIGYFHRIGEPDAPAMTIFSESLKAGEQSLKIGIHSIDFDAPFVVDVNDRTACIFHRGDPRFSLLEADCYTGDSPLPACQARLNFQGYRPAPKPFLSHSIPDALLHGKFPAIAPEKLFEETDFDRARARETQRNETLDTWVVGL